MGEKQIDLITYSTRCALYDEYCKELSKFDPQIYASRTEVMKWCQDYMDENYTWLDITVAGRTIGFIIIGEKALGADISPQFDYFIEQTYIMPDYRRKGFVFNVLNKFVSKHKGKYGLLIIQNNFKARDFWRYTIPRLGGYQIPVNFDGFMVHGAEVLTGFEVK